MTEKEIKQMQADNEALRHEVDQLKNEIIRLVERNLDLSQRLEEDVELRRRAEVAREILSKNIERQRNADLQDDGQLMALLEIRVEQDNVLALPDFDSKALAKLALPDFDSKALAKLLGVSHERLVRLFRRSSIYTSPDAYLDNLRTLLAMRLLRDKPQYSIAAVAEESGLKNIRTLQRRIQEAVGMTPVEYRMLFNRDV